MSTTLYEMELAWLGLIRNWRGMTIAVVMIAIGVTAIGTLLTVLRVVHADPIPRYSRELLRVQMDPRRTAGPEASGVPDDLSFTDAIEIYRAGPAVSSVLMTRSSVRAIAANGDTALSGARYTTHEFFSMFEVPLRHGRWWNATDDRNAATVAVISSQLNDRLFAGRHSIGNRISVQGSQFVVIGVLGAWRPAPRFYDLSEGAFAVPEGIFVPFSTARKLALPLKGQMSCWDGSDPNVDLENALCAWIQLWVHLPTEQDRRRYREYLQAYAGAHGRTRSTTDTSFALSNVQEWLRAKRAIPDGLGLFTVIAVGFLALCLINTATYLMSNFESRSRELSIRRALGSSQGGIRHQLLAESLLVGATGGHWASACCCGW